MNQIYTAVMKERSGCWIGWIEEVPGVNCQEATREELLDTLGVTLREVLELNREDALKAAVEKHNAAVAAVKSLEKNSEDDVEKIVLIPEV